MLNFLLAAETVTGERQHNAEIITANETSKDSTLFIYIMIPLNINLNYDVNITYDTRFRQ